jgi:hypothetical protein
VAFWQALRLVGIASEISRYGRIFADRAAQQQTGAVRLDAGRSA